MQDGQSTRHKLLEAALDLFATQGYDQTTARQIAEAANVTERSFFKHFATKSEAVGKLGPEDLEALTRRVADAPGELPDLDAVESALTAWYLRSIDPAEHKRVVRRLVEASASSVVVRGTLTDYLDACIGAVAIGLARRRDEAEPSVASRLLSAAVLRVHQIIVREWAASDEAFDVLAARYYGQLNGILRSQDV